MVKRKTSSGHLVGQTKSAGFDVGARKTFEVSPEQAWDFITSPVGQALWLGHVDGFRLEEGYEYQTREGALGMVRVVEPGGHFRLTWGLKSWARPSTVQVRIIPRNGKTVVAFHQEHLSGPAQRDAMRRRWVKVLKELERVFGGGES